MKRFALAFVITLLAVAPLTAQTPEAEVRATVDRLFDAMRRADGGAAAELFHPEARLQSVSALSGETRVTSDAIAGFVQAVGTPRTEVWDERIWNVEIRVDDDLATAWMNYAFYVDDQFSHCGVNAFQLARVAGEWRILQIVDTRRRTECDLPA